MIACTACRHRNPNGSGFCEGCGAALHDPRKAAREADEIEAEFMLDQARRARGAFLVVGGLQLLAAVLAAAIAPAGLDVVEFAFDATLAAMFFALAFWCSRQPFAATLVGLFLYGGLNLIDAMLDPSSLFRGIVIKVFVIMALVRAARAAFAHREFVRSRGMG